MRTSSSPDLGPRNFAAGYFCASVSRVGPGPARETLAQKYPAAKFLGPKSGEELVRIYAASDVNVFPSLTDTFGLVMLEALACGTPVATFPHAVMQDVVGGCKAAALDGDRRARSEEHTSDLQSR